MNKYLLAVIVAGLASIVGVSYLTYKLENRAWKLTLLTQGVDGSLVVVGQGLVKHVTHVQDGGICYDRMEDDIRVCTKTSAYVIVDAQG